PRRCKSCRPMAMSGNLSGKDRDWLSRRVVDCDDDAAARSVVEHEYVSALGAVPGSNGTGEGLWLSCSGADSHCAVIGNECDDSRLKVLRFSGVVVGSDGDHHRVARNFAGRLRGDLNSLQLGDIDLDPGAELNRF